MISLPPKFLCPALTRSARTQAARAPRRIKSPLVQNIAKLEEYIKSLQRTVKKQSLGTKQALEEEASDHEITELYKSLSSTPARIALPTPRELIPGELARIMFLKAHSSSEDVDWDAACSALVSSRRFLSLSSKEINIVLEAMPHEARIKAGLEILNKMKTAPDALTFDLFMDSYASCAQPDQALAMFDRSRGVGIRPSLYSYAHLMKAFAVTKDLKRASAMYQHMREQKIEPNLVIYTSLIATCVRTRNTNEAFTIFDALKYKSSESAPDAHTYSLMIYACSLDSRLSAERASDLFTEMTGKGLKPTKETFNSLIHVYASRRDYFAESWRMSEMMQSNGIEMDKITWHSLLSACVSHRDLKRARTLVREMMRISKTNRHWTPDAITYQLLFRAYAHAKVRRSLTPIDIIELHKEVQPSATSDLWINQEPFSSDDLLQESSNIMDYIRLQHSEILSTQLIDTYLTISQSFEAPERFKRDWESLYAVHPKGKFSYEIALQASYNFKDWTLLQQVWSERQAWRASQPPMSITGNVLSQTDHYGDFVATRLYIESLSRLNRIQQASQVLDEARTRFTFEKGDLKCFQTKSIQVGDEDAVLLYRDMFPEQHQYHSKRQENRYF